MSDVDFIIYKGIESTYSFVVKDEKSTLPMRIFDSTLIETIDFNSIPSVYTVNTVGLYNQKIPLNIKIPKKSTNRGTISYIKIKNVPDQSVLSAGTKNIDGTWTVDTSSITDLKITPNLVFPNGFTITILVVVNLPDTLSTIEYEKSIKIKSLREVPNLAIQGIIGYIGQSIPLSMIMAQKQNIELHGGTGLNYNKGTVSAGTTTVESSDIDNLTITADSVKDLTLQISSGGDSYSVPVLIINTESSNLNSTTFIIRINASMLASDKNLEVSVKAPNTHIQTVQNTDNTSGIVSTTSQKLNNLSVSTTATSDNNFSILLEYSSINIDTFKAEFRTIGQVCNIVNFALTGDPVTEIPLQVTDAKNGTIKLVLTKEQTSVLNSDKRSKQERFLVRPSYSMLIKCSTLRNGYFIVEVPEIYVK